MSEFGNYLELNNGESVTCHILQETANCALKRQFRAVLTFIRNREKYETRKNQHPIRKLEKN